MELTAGRGGFGSGLRFAGLGLLRLTTGSSSDSDRKDAVRREGWGDGGFSVLLGEVRRCSSARWWKKILQPNINSLIVSLNR